MILTSPKGFHYPDRSQQIKQGRVYTVVGSRTIGKVTYYSVKNDRGEFKDMTDKELFNFFTDQTP